MQRQHVTQVPSISEGNGEFTKHNENSILVKLYRLEISSGRQVMSPFTTMLQNLDERVFYLLMQVCRMMSPKYNIAVAVECVAKQKEYKVWIDSLDAWYEEELMSFG